MCPGDTSLRTGSTWCPQWLWLCPSCLGLGHWSEALGLGDFCRPGLREAILFAWHSHSHVTPGASACTFLFPSARGPRASKRVAFCMSPSFWVGTLGWPHFLLRCGGVPSGQLQ